MNPIYPLLEVLSAKTERPVCLVVWHIRAIYEGGETEAVTCIQYANGDVFESSEPIGRVILRFHECIDGATNANVQY